MVPGIFKITLADEVFQLEDESAFDEKRQSHDNHPATDF
jgi:hypothetical protein